MTFSPDFIFTASQIIASNSVKREQQGITGSLIGTLATYGQSIGLGFAGTVEKYTTEGGEVLVQGYRHALYFGIDLGGAALLLDLLFVRVDADRREGWAKEGQDSTIPAFQMSQESGAPAIPAHSEIKLRKDLP